MSKRPLLVLVLIAIVAAGAWLAFSPKSTTRPAEEPPLNSKKFETPAASLPLSADARPEPDAGHDGSSTFSNPGNRTATGPDIGDILSAPGDDLVTTAKKLAKLVLDPRRSEEERTEALAHTLNLSANNEAEVLLPMIKDANLTADQCRTILSDALNNSFDWQAKVYLEALGTRKEPDLRKEIREHLQFLTDGDDLGDNPKNWEQPLKDALVRLNNQ